MAYPGQGENLILHICPVSCLCLTDVHYHIYFIRSGIYSQTGLKGLGPGIHGSQRKACNSGNLNRRAGTVNETADAAYMAAVYTDLCKFIADSLGYKFENLLRGSIGLKQRVIEIFIKSLHW